MRYRGSKKPRRHHFLDSIRVSAVSRQTESCARFEMTRIFLVPFSKRRMRDLRSRCSKRFMIPIIIDAPIISSFIRIRSPPSSCPLPQGQQQSLDHLPLLVTSNSQDDGLEENPTNHHHHPNDLPFRRRRRCPPSAAESTNASHTSIQHHHPGVGRDSASFNLLGVNSINGDIDLYFSPKSAVPRQHPQLPALHIHKKRRRSREYYQDENNNHITMKSQQPLQKNLLPGASLHEDDDDDENVEEHEIPSDNNQRTLDCYLEDAYQYYHSSTSSDEPHHHSSCCSCSCCQGNTMMMRWCPLQKWRYWAVMLSLGVANSSDASEILCLSYILSDTNFEDTMLQDTKWRAGLLASAVFLGMLVGGLLVGTLGDFMGRRPMLLLGLIFNSVAGLLSAVTTNVWQLSFIRMLAGLGIGATVPPLFTLVTELAPPSRRGFFVTVCASFWMVGSIYVAVSALVLLQWWSASWRVFAVACAVPSAAGAILVALLVPESPRFCALNGNHPEAVHIANGLAQKMSYDSTAAPPLTLPELLAQFPLRQPVIPMNDGLAMSTITSPTYSWPWLRHIMKLALSDFLQSTSTLYTPHLKSTTLPLQLVWFSLNFGTYGILTWINTLFKVVHLENVYYNALLFALANLPGNILSATLMDRMGRSTMLVGSSLAAAASLLSFAFFASAELSSSGSGVGINSNSTNSSDLLVRWLESSSQSSSSTTATNYITIGIVASACAFQCFSIAAWNTIDCMTSELFPTPVRSTGMGVCAASGRIGAMVAQFVNGALVSNPVRLLLVASSSLVLGAMTPCLLPAGGDLTGQPVHDVVDHRPQDRNGPTGSNSSSRRSSRGSIRSLLHHHHGGPSTTEHHGVSMEQFDGDRDVTTTTTINSNKLSSAAMSAATPYMRVKNSPPPTYQQP